MAQFVPHLLILSHVSVGESLLCLDHISKNKNFSLLRSGQSHNSQTLQVWSATSKVQLELPAKPQDQCWIENPSENFVKAYFRQNKTTVEKNLLILESETLSALLESAHQLEQKSQYQLMDIERGSGYRKQAIAYLANGSTANYKSYIQQSVSAQLIEQPTPTVLSLFNV